MKIPLAQVSQIDAYTHNITRKTITRLLFNQFNLKNRWYVFFICPHSNPIADFIKLKQLLCTCFQHCVNITRNVILVYLCVCVCVCAAPHYCHCFHSKRAIERERNKGDIVNVYVFKRRRLLFLVCFFLLEIQFAWMASSWKRRSATLTDLPVSSPSLHFDSFDVIIDST